MTALTFVYDDGGRAAAGYKGPADDCVCRAIAIAAGMPYQQVYDALNQLGHAERLSRRRKSKSSARTGVHKPTIRRYMAAIAWTWTPVMFVGQGCTVLTWPTASCSPAGSSSTCPGTPWP